MSWPIRLCTIDDYSAVVTLFQHYRPSYTIEAMRDENEHRDPKCKFQHWITEYKGDVLAYASYDQNPRMYHPRKFQIGVTLHPDYEGQENQEFVSAVYDHIIAELQPLDPLSVLTYIRDNGRYRYHIDLLKAKGFQEVQRDCWLSLDVTAFDFGPYAATEEKLLNEGIEIKTFKELEADSNRNHKLHALENEIYQDVPFPEQTTAVNFDYFVQNKLNNPGFLSEAYFVAIHNSEYIGLSFLEARPGENYLFTGLTGVKPPFRSKRIAQILKLREITYAKAQGFLTVRTANNINNKLILKLNERLGFIMYHTVVSLEKVFH